MSGESSKSKRGEGSRVSYASAGVDIEAGDRAVEMFKPLAKRATRPEVRGGLGGFAGLFALIYGAAYRLFGRNLWPLILVHGTWNSFAIWGAYAG